MLWASGVLSGFSIASQSSVGVSESWGSGEVVDCLVPAAGVSLEGAAGDASEAGGGVDVEGEGDGRSEDAGGKILL